MREAGAEKIIFIHGFELKKDVVDYFGYESKTFYSENRGLC